MIKSLAIKTVVGETIIYDALAFSRIYRTVPLNDIVRLFPPDDIDKPEVRNMLIKKLEEKFGRN